MTAWLDNDLLFTEKLREGHAAAELVGSFINTMSGLPVTVTPMVLRSHVSRRHEFADEFDLSVGGRRVEVKSRDVRFHGAHDYPFPTAFVYSHRGWAAKTTKPVAIVLVSQQTGGMAVIPASTEQEWTTRQIHDEERQIDYVVLEVRREKLRPMDEFIDWLLA